MERPERSATPGSWLQIKQTYHNAKQNFWNIQYHNYRTFRQQPLIEISGSFGDLGTLLPILIALTNEESISLSSTLVFGGLANILTGIVFGIPLPVQPMKAIAAVAIARHLQASEVMSAGLFVAGAIGVLSFTGLIRWFTNVIPIPVVKGIQIGTGLSLIVSAGGLYENTPTSACILILAFLALLASTTFKRIPYALIVLLAGIISLVISALKDDSSRNHSHTSPSLVSIWQPEIHVPSPAHFLTGTVSAGTGQLPLTTLNSVIAVSFLAADLFPPPSEEEEEEEEETSAFPPPPPPPSLPPPPSTTALGLSVMTINLLGCWFSSMPVCHGSGGLAAQYRFGARSGSSIIFLGLLKLLLGLFAAPLASTVFSHIPRTLLCVLLIAAGLELLNVGESLNIAGARDVRESDHRRGLPRRSFRRENDLRHGGQHGEADEVVLQRERDQLERGGTGTLGQLLGDEQERKRRWATCFTTVAGILAFRNDAVGFAAGMLCHWSFGFLDRLESGWRRHGSVRLE